VLVHLDTDIGGDPDDACALALLLGWPEVGLTGVTSTIDPAGVRAGCARYCLGLAGRGDVPVVAGAEMSLTRRQSAGPYTDERYWPTGVAPVASSPGAAIDALADAIASGATVVAVGPLTNLALLELARPGSLADARLVVMGGWVRALDDDLPSWGPDADFNVQWDVRAAEVVLGAARDLTLVTLADTLRTHVRRRDLPALEVAGRLGPLLARQAVAYAEDRDHPTLARAHSGLPDDLLHFLHDPLTCAVALGWPGVRTEQRRLRPTVTDGVLVMAADEPAPVVRVVSAVDAPAFTERWLESVAAA
jgi:inosine-uridine nucleoside N-ribohydrolase